MTTRSFRSLSKWVIQSMHLPTDQMTQQSLQENYLKTQPAKIRNLDGPPQILKQLELMDKAASSISDGDLVDALIHG